MQIFNLTSVIMRVQILGAKYQRYKWVVLYTTSNLYHPFTQFQHQNWSQI